jgi:hypothetical protein
MSVLLTTLRPTDWNFPLFVHVLGAMILVGGVLTCAAALAFARGNIQQLRLGYWSLLFVGLPGLIVMRIGATAIWHKYNPNHSFFWAIFPHPGKDPGWIEIGGTVGDLGGAGLVLALILGWFGIRRLDGATEDVLTKVPVVGKMEGELLLKGTLLISLLLLAGYVLAVWAMAGKHPVGGI